MEEQRCGWETVVGHSRESEVLNCVAEPEQMLSG